MLQLVPHLVLAATIFALFSSSTAMGVPCKITPPQVTWLDCKTTVPSYVQALVGSTTYNETILGRLPSSLKCGSLEVPMDYSKPISSQNTIIIGFTVRSALKESIQDPLFFNPGGPGAPAAWLGWIAATNLSAGGVASAQDFAGLEAFDIVFPDIRGTDLSNPLNCSIPLGSALAAPHATNDTEFKAMQARSLAFAKSCEDNTEPKGFTQFVGAYEAMKDWEQLRIALGYRIINIIGTSYGTYYGVEYAQQYPDSVGRFAMDSVCARGMDNYQVVGNDVRSANRYLERVDAWCLGEAACPFHAKGKGAVQAVYASLLVNATAATDGTYTPFEVQSGMYNLLINSDTNFTAITSVLDAAVKGDSTVFAPQLLAQDVVNRIAMTCLDEKIDQSFEAFQNLATEAAKYDKYSLDQSAWWSVFEACAGWPYPGRDKNDWHSEVPFLWINADFDEITAYEQAVWMKERSPQSTLLQRHGDGHGTVARVGLVARDLEIAYLNTGIVPNSTNTTLAEVYGPGRTPPAVPDSYAVVVGPLAGDD